eukprot:5573925-Alexandrium_andersonii.AAC.1
MPSTPVLGAAVGSVPAAITPTGERAGERSPTPSDRTEVRCEEAVRERKETSASLEPKQPWPFAAPPALAEAQQAK